MVKGLFIALEGPDGSGKSTIAKLLQDHIQNSYETKCTLTREPGGTSIGEKIREILLDNNNKEMIDETEALLYAASRAQHANEKILPLLEKGEVVISDRYFYSSLAYQGYARGLGIDRVMEINKFAINNVYPDVVLFFELSPEKALERKFINREGDRIENAGVDFHRTTYEGYEKAISMYSKNVVKIDASGTVEETLSNCIKAIEENTSFKKKQSKVKFELIIDCLSGKTYDHKKDVAFLSLDTLRQVFKFKEEIDKHSFKNLKHLSDYKHILKNEKLFYTRSGLPVFELITISGLRCVYTDNTGKNFEIHLDDDFGIYSPLVK